jgi:hypothetical protein
MNRIHTTSKSAIFLIELIFAILLFSVTAGICVRLFVQAHFVTTQSRDLSMAVTASRSAAERMKVLEADTGALQQQISGSVLVDADHLVVYYDKEWQTTDAQQAVYCMDILINRSGNRVATVIDVWEQENARSIYQMNTEQYIAGE